MRPKSVYLFETLNAHTGKWETYSNYCAYCRDEARQTLKLKQSWYEGKYRIAKYVRVEEKV